MHKTFGTTIKLILKNAQRIADKYGEGLRHAYIEKHMARYGYHCNAYYKLNWLIISYNKRTDDKGNKLKWRTFAKMGRIALKKGKLVDLRQVLMKPQDPRKWEFIDSPSVDMKKSLVRYQRINFIKTVLIESLTDLDPNCHTAREMKQAIELIGSLL